MHDLAALLDVASGLAREAGALLLDGMAGRGQGVVTKTSLTDMVTDMDHASEALIVDGLRRVRPDDGILGEEGSRREGRSGVRWVIDPLDGTTNYLYGLPAFTVSIAAEVDDHGAVGVVFDPSRDELFTAVRGDGARCNDEVIAVSGATDLATALVATGFSYAAAERNTQAEVVSRVLPTVRDIRRFGAASLDLCMVACGRVDAYYESVLQPWDVAAGMVIATEAGATVLELGRPSGPSRQASVLAASPALAEPLRRLVDESTRDT